jgi:release factor glutamine methyltransferase
MLRVGDAVDNATLQLAQIVGGNARSECLQLMSFATGRQVSSLRLSLDDEISLDHFSEFTTAVAKRLKHQPISQIIGYRDFWKHRFIVTPDVLDPRPDTETLIEKAVEMGPFETILDLGTGSGCILLSLLAEWPTSIGHGIDASKPALSVARGNAGVLGLNARSEFEVGNWCDGITTRYDLVVSNPPYITQQAMDGIARGVREWEPRMALTPEGDGLDAYRAIAASVQNVMKPTGLLLLEIGFDQGPAVIEILTEQGMTDIHLFQDINGKDRVVLAHPPVQAFSN